MITEETFKGYCLAAATQIDHNEHTDALISIAKGVGQTKIVEELEELKNRHLMLGHLSPSIEKWRAGLRAELKNYIEEHHPSWIVHARGLI